MMLFKTFYSWEYYFNEVLSSKIFGCRHGLMLKMNELFYNEKVHGN